MSVKSTLASTRSKSGSIWRRPPVRNASISPRIAIASPTHGLWSTPGNSTYFAPLMCRARYRPCSTLTERSPVRCKTNVGTPIVGSTCRTSMTEPKCEMTWAAPGLALARSNRPTNFRSSSSPARLGLYKSTDLPCPQFSSIHFKLAAICSSVWPQGLSGAQAQRAYAPYKISAEVRCG